MGRGRNREREQDDKSVLKIKGREKKERGEEKEGPDRPQQERKSLIEVKCPRRLCGRPDSTNCAVFHPKTKRISESPGKNIHKLHGNCTSVKTTLIDEQ